MHGDDAPGGDDWATMTHARIRVAQGDVGQARRILHTLLRRDPSHEEAAELLQDLARRRPTPHTDPAPEPCAPREPGRTEKLAPAFRAQLGRPSPSPPPRRIERLRRWLNKIAPQP